MTEETAAPAVSPEPDLSKLYEALAKANASFAPIPRSRTVNVRMKNGGFYTFSYAPLDEILSAVRKPLADNGLALMQRVIRAEDKEAVETMLVHQSGQSVGNRVKVLVLDSGPQPYNSALTYSRRAGVTLLLCLAPEDDDDGNAAEGNQVEGSEDENVAFAREQRVSSVRDIVVDPDTMAEYARRIVELIDNQDPAGALNLYYELNQLEKDHLWNMRQLKAKIGNTDKTYRGELRKAGKAVQP